MKKFAFDLGRKGMSEPETIAAIDTGDYALTVEQLAELGYAWQMGTEPLLEDEL
jgi:hypothetical protein